MVVRRYIYIDFLILLIPTPLVSALFCSILTFCSFKKMFFVLVTVRVCNLCNSFFAQYKHTYRRLWAFYGSHMKAAHNEEVHTNERFISCDGHQLYAFKGGV